MVAAAERPTTFEFTYDLDDPIEDKIEAIAKRVYGADGIFLLNEINRAEIVPDTWDDLNSRVTGGSWVTFCTNWGVPRRTVHLVWPEECWSDPARISVLTPLGAALIGLQVGDQMPYVVAGCLNVVRVQSVSQSSPNVVPLVRSSRRKGPCDDDPGPSAA